MIIEQIIREIIIIITDNEYYMILVLVMYDIGLLKRVLYSRKLGYINYPTIKILFEFLIFIIVTMTYIYLSFFFSWNKEIISI